MQEETQVLLKSSDKRSKVTEQRKESPMKVYVMSAMVLILGCGPKDVLPPRAPAPVPTVTPTPAAPVAKTPAATPTPVALVPLTYEFLDEKKWSAVRDGHLLEMTLETGCAEWQNVEPWACLKKSDSVRMFHYWLYTDKTNESELAFFAVGRFNLSGTKMCFSDINFWAEPPAYSTIKSTKDFCITAFRSPGEILESDWGLFESAPLR
jgi:hypothetical protein